MTNPLTLELTQAEQELSLARQSGDRDRKASVRRWNSQIAMERSLVNVGDALMKAREP